MNILCSAKITLKFLENNGVTILILYAALTIRAHIWTTDIPQHRPTYIWAGKGKKTKNMGTYIFSVSLQLKMSNSREYPYEMKTLSVMVNNHM